MLLLVVACGLGWAGFDLTRKLLVREIPPVALVFLLTIGSVPLFAAWMAQQGAAGRGRGTSRRRSPRCSSTSWPNLLFLEGMRIAPLSVTIPLLSLTPVFATLLAIPLLGERPTALARLRHPAGGRRGDRAPRGGGPRTAGRLGSRGR